jgi:hypothetical protein
METGIDPRGGKAVVTPHSLGKLIEWKRFDCFYADLGRTFGINYSPLVGETN